MTSQNATGCLLATLATAIGIGVGIVLCLALVVLAGGRAAVDIIEGLLASQLGTLLLLTITLANVIWLLKGLRIQRVLVGNLLLILASALAIHLTNL